MGLKEANIKSMSREDFKNNDYIDRLVEEHRPQYSQKYKVRCLLI